jgi:quinol monooxygenase YgiN
VVLWHIPILKIARFETKPDARSSIEAAVRAFAEGVARELGGTSWTTYREKSHPDRWVSLIWAASEEADARHRNAAVTRKFVEALYPEVIGEVRFTEYEIVASSLERPLDDQR